MQITGTKQIKYYFLVLVGALMVAVGVLAVAPSAQAQQADPITVDKECSPNPVRVGQSLSCTIDVGPTSLTVSGGALVRDTFPAGLTVTGATLEQFSGGFLIGTVDCMVTGNTVGCSGAVSGARFFPERTLRVTIEAIVAPPCGTVTTPVTTNTAEVEFRPIRGPSQTVTDTEEITVEGTVEGCDEEEAGVGGAGGGAGRGAGGGTAPITQEGEQESEAGEIDQSFEVS